MINGGGEDSISRQPDIFVILNAVRTHVSTHPTHKPSELCKTRPPSIMLPAMKLILPLFAMILAALGADGQTCERTIPVGLAVPGTNGADFEATLNRRLLTVVKVEPFHHSRILVLIQADFSHLKAHDKDFRRVVDWLAAIDRIPENAALAYGLYSEKIAFSNRFTSDPQELRSDLNELV